MNATKEYDGNDISEDSGGYEVAAAMPSSPVMASTYNLDLIYECGTCNVYDFNQI